MRLIIYIFCSRLVSLGSSLKVFLIAVIRQKRFKRCLSNNFALNLNLSMYRLYKKKLYYIFNAHAQIACVVF